MRCPTIDQLPPPPTGREGWPWTEGSPQLPDTASDGTAWPRISIVTPSYNRHAFIEESLRSVLLQGYPDLELIVVDGASDDGTLEVLERYRPWLAHCISEPDRGWRDAVAKGFGRCTGEIATFFSSDDIYLPGAFGHLARSWRTFEAREGTEQGLAVGAFFHVDDRSRRQEPVAIAPRLPGSGPLDLSLVDPTDWRLHQVATFYRLSALDEVGRELRDELVYNADRELLYRICRRFPVTLIPEALAAFRIHPGSLAGAGARRHAAEAEYAEMQLSFCCGDGQDHVRRRIARHYQAKGQISFAKYNGTRLEAMAALLRAAGLRPAVLGTRAYLRTWLSVLGLVPRPARSRPAS